MDNYAAFKRGARKVPRKKPQQETPVNDDDDEREPLAPLNAAKLFSYLLCSAENCEASLSDCAKRLKNFAGVRRAISEQEALAFILKFRDRFDRRTVDGNQFVEAKTKLKLCDAFLSGKCKNPDCKQLHICRFFLQGTCKFDESCKNGHSFSSAQTQSLLQQHKLKVLPEKALLSLFRKVLNEKRIRHTSQSSGVPQPCSFYNKGSNCKNGDKCPFLHVCEHFVGGECKFGSDKCRRDHHFETAHSKKVLATHGLGNLRDSGQILRKLNPGRDNVDAGSDDDSLFFGSSPKVKSPPTSPLKSSLKNSPRSPPPTSPPTNPQNIPPPEKLEICGFNLRGKCSYGDKCNARHTPLPYAWEYSANLRGQLLWSSFDDEQNRKIEEAFCKCAESQVHAVTNEKMMCLVNFETLTGKLRQIGQGPECGVIIQLRRLSTVSSVLAAEGHVFRTLWKWYWQDEHGMWKLYDDGENTSSNEIELKYLSDSVDKKHLFTHGSNKYNIDLNDPQHLYQQNLHYKTKRDVRRRPARFVDEDVMKKMLQDFKLKCQRQRAASASSTPDAPSVPDHWALLDAATTDQDFQLVRLSESINYDEYKEVKQQFMKTMDGHKIKSVKRVQNVTLWEDYERQKSKIAKKNSVTKPNERWLFHGTNKDTVNPICQQGFDWRLCGKHGTRYGKGSYFATDASYSHNYSKPSMLSGLSGLLGTSTTGESQMFMVKVIVGSYVVGGYEMARPPSKDSSNPMSPLHDSCVNNVIDPTIFVVFERHQAYPYYIITYE